MPATHHYHLPGTLLHPMLLHVLEGHPGLPVGLVNSTVISNDEVPGLIFRAHLACSHSFAHGQSWFDDIHTMKNLLGCQKIRQAGGIIVSSHVVFEQSKIDLLLALDAKGCLTKAGWLSYFPRLSWFMLQPFMLRTGQCWLDQQQESPDRGAKLACRKACCCFSQHCSVLSKKGCNDFTCSGAAHSGHEQ